MISGTWFNNMNDSHVPSKFRKFKTERIRIQTSLRSTTLDLLAKSPQRKETINSKHYKIYGNALIFFRFNTWTLKNKIWLNRSYHCDIVDDSKLNPILFHQMNDNSTEPSAESSLIFSVAPVGPDPDLQHTITHWFSFSFTDIH